MMMKLLRMLLILISVNISIPVFSQDYVRSRTEIIIDSLRKSGMILKETPEKPQIILSKDEALKFLLQKYQSQYWKDSEDSLRRAIERLLFEVSNTPYDSTEIYLQKYPYDSINIPWERFYTWKSYTIELSAAADQNIQDSLHVPDTISAISDTTRIINYVNTISLDSLNLVSDTILYPEGTLQRQQSLIQPADTSLLPVITDSLVVETLTTAVTEPADTTIFYLEDTLHVVGSESKSFPFVFYSNPYQDDSLRVAVETLIDYLQVRDSSILNITGSGAADTHIWLNSRSGMMRRYWLKNELNDSITVWIGSPSRNTIGLYLEKGVDFRRTQRQQNYVDARVEVEQVDKKTLQQVSGIEVKRNFWKYRTEASFALNQTSLTNWVKGGESSVSTSMDITGFADYDNKEMKMTSANFARLKFGLIWTDEKGIRKNLDLLETNSKLNHKAFGKFDFSGILLFKSQIAEGKRFFQVSGRDTSEVVSKFFNPATLTAGFGLDYKPNKNTSINFSPLSYKGTFVPDTINIDQTKYGVAADRRSKHEPGLSFMITNKYSPVKTVTITNRLQLFTNYINKPQNVDIDWEMIVTASLNWFTDVRLNTHFIYDDDTKTPVFDKEDKPVMGPDGKQKTTARPQFKEILGFSFIFRF